MDVEIGEEAEMALHASGIPIQFYVGNLIVPGGGTWWIRAANARLLRGRDLITAWADSIPKMRQITVPEGDAITVLTNGTCAIASQFPATSEGLTQTTVVGTPQWLLNGQLSVMPLARNGQNASMYLGWIPPITFFEGAWGNPEVTSLNTKSLAQDNFFTRPPLLYRREFVFVAPQPVQRASDANYQFIKAPAGVRSVYFVISVSNALSNRPVWIVVSIGAFGGGWGSATVARGTITKALLMPMQTEENNPNYHIAINAPDLIVNPNDQIGITAIENNIVASGATWNAWAGTYEGSFTNHADFMKIKPSLS